MTLNLGCIVEGHGEVSALPILIRRIQLEVRPEVHLNIPRPTRVGRYKLVQPGELENALERLARRLTPPRALLVLIDADDDCPKELAPLLAARAAKARSDIACGIVLAKFEFEAWFLAAIESLGGKRGVKKGVLPVPDPETIRDAKGCLSRHMEGNRSYSATVDQAALTEAFDMKLAHQRSGSFDKCWREIERLLVPVTAEKANDALESG